MYDSIDAPCGACGIQANEDIEEIEAVAYEQGRQEEREETMRWLRRRAAKAALTFGPGTLELAKALDALANDHELGEHLNGVG